MIPVVLISPFSGATKEIVEENITYAYACVADCLHRGESAMGGHLIFPKVLDDASPEERQKGIDAGQAWIPFTKCVVVYIDRGISNGMWDDITASFGSAGMDVAFRALKEENKALAEHYYAMFERFRAGPNVSHVTVARSIQAIRFFVEGQRP